MDRTATRNSREKCEFKKGLEKRTAMFAVQVFRSLDSLPATVSSRVIGYQLGKSASSIGANYREANRAESEDDFTHKIGITLKECAESVYWLDIVRQLYPDNPGFDQLAQESDELLRIFQSVRRKLHEARKAK